MAEEGGRGQKRQQGHVLACFINIHFDLQLPQGLGNAYTLPPLITLTPLSILLKCQALPLTPTPSTSPLFSLCFYRLINSLLRCQLTTMPKRHKSNSSETIAKFVTPPPPLAFLANSYLVLPPACWQPTHLIKQQLPTPLSPGPCLPLRRC